MIFFPLGLRGDALCRAAPLRASNQHLTSSYTSEFCDHSPTHGNMREIDPLISEYQHEKRRPRESEALLILRKVASLVKPIMRQRAWRVGTLCEFYPQQRNLLGLNINQGQKICLRLRYPSDHGQFLPIEQVVDTMLHE